MSLVCCQQDVARGREVRKTWLGATNGGPEEPVNLPEGRDRGFIRTRLKGMGAGVLHEHQRRGMIL